MFMLLQAEQMRLTMARMNDIRTIMVVMASDNLRKVMEHRCVILETLSNFTVYLYVLYKEAVCLEVLTKGYQSKRQDPSPM